jgi:hypothetical protein
LLKFRYISSSLELHIWCAIDPPTTAAGQGSNGHAAAFQGSYAAYGSAAQGIHGGVAEQRSLGSPAGQGWYPYHGGPVTPGGYNYVTQVHGGGPVIPGGYAYTYPVQQGGYYASAMPMPTAGYYGATGSSGQSTLHNPGRLMTAIARFLLGIAISTTVSDFASQLLSGG